MAGKLLRAGSSTSTRTLRSDGTNDRLDDDDEIEVEVAKQNLKVSKDAWKSFQVYRQYSDWSSETEKTDYTYSRLSSYRDKEIFPGFPVRPNLCRSPIRSVSPSSEFSLSRTEVINQNNLNNSTYYFARNSINEDNTHSFVANESITLFQRIRLFFTAIWTVFKSAIVFCRDKLQSGVQILSWLLAGSSIYIWTKVADSLSFVNNSILLLWQRIFGTQSDEKVVAFNESTEENSWSVFITRRVHTIITSVTTIYRKASSANSSENSKIKYIWLLLLLLLLLTGWLLISNGAESDNSIISSIQSGWSSHGVQYLYDTSLEYITSLRSIFRLPDFLNYVPDLPKYITNSAFFIISFVTECLSYLLDTLRNLSLLILVFFTNLSETLTIALSESFLYFGHLFWLAYNQTSYPVQETQFSAAEELAENEFYSHNSEDVAATVLKLQALEKLLEAEKLKRQEEDAKFENVLKQYYSILQKHKLDTEVASQRCCKRPCSFAPPAASSPLQKAGSEQLEMLIASAQEKSSAQLVELRRELDNLISAKQYNLNVNAGSMDVEEIRKIALDAIKTYDADKTGRADYALESAGGRVVSIRCTKTYTNKGYPSWGFPIIWSPTSEPEDAIRPSTAPGECWAFYGSVGYLVLELSYKVNVTGFTIEHIDKSLSPYGSIDSAPQHFSVWGLKNADDLYDQYLFGDYVFEDSGETIQYFPVKNPSELQFKFVELKIISNHGHPEYTCLYRIRVHGAVS